MNIKELIDSGVDAAELFVKAEELNAMMLKVKEADDRLYKAISAAINVEDQLKEMLSPAIEKNGYPLVVDFGDGKSFVVTPEGIEDGDEDGDED